MIRLVPQELLNLVNSKLEDYYYQYLRQRHHLIDQIIYNNITIYLIFNLNNKEVSSCKTYTYKNKVYSTININAGSDILSLQEYDLQNPLVSQIVLQYFKCIAAHELLHTMQHTQPSKYLPYKKRNNHPQHELKDIEFYPNLINYQYQAKNNFFNFINNKEEINKMYCTDFNRYKKICKILYKDNYE